MKEDLLSQLDGEGKASLKRTSTYQITSEEKSPFITAMEQQEKEIENKIFDEKDSQWIIDINSSSEDDEEFIRKSMIHNQQRFSVRNMNYFNSELLIDNKEEKADHKPTLIIWKEEKTNGLASLWDELISLNDLVTDKNDRIFTNFDCLLFYLEVSDIIKLQKWSRSLWRIFNTEQLKRLVRIGNLDENLRAQFWISQMPFFSFQNEVREKFGITDLFTNAYEWILEKLKTDDPISDKIINEIGKSDLNLFG